MSDFAVEALNIYRTFQDGEVHALDDVTLHVARGEVFGLLGPNGSGKTTMVRILSTILAPTSGSAVVNGYNVVEQPDEVRRSIGLAGQFATVDENLTGLENLRMIGKLNHLENAFVKRRSSELLEQFGLSDAAGRTAKTYSGGMRRRLDPQSRQDLWAIIEGLVESGTTVLLTTQYLEEADRLAKQLVVLDHGKIIAQGTSQELKSRLGNTVLSVSFASTSNAQHASMLLSDLSLKPANLEGTVVEITVDQGPQAAADALRRIDAAGLELTGLVLREPSLDDVFLSLTGHKTEDETAASTEPTSKRRRKGRR